MKPASIIFLCVALVIAGGGFFLCSRAQKQATEQQIELFNISTDAEGNRVSVVKYDTSEMEKIAITLGEGTVYIRRGSEQKIEIFNLYEGAYFKGVSNNTLQINDTLSIMDIVKEGALGISFSGIRNLLRDFRPLLRDKSVVISVPDNIPLNSICVTVNKGNIVCEGINTAADVILTAENGSITVSGTSTSAVLRADGKTSEISISGGFINDLRVTNATGNVSMQDTMLKSASLAVSGKGDITLGLVAGVLNYAGSFTAPGGVTLDGAMLGGSYETGAASSLVLNASSADGAIAIND